MVSKEKHIFTVRSPSPERAEYSLDGERLIAATLDVHGWSGMDAIDETIRKIAVRIGAEVRHESAGEVGGRNG